MAKVVNVALDQVARGKAHQSLTGSLSLPARGTDLTVFQSLLSFGILGHESTAQGHNFVFKHNNAPLHRAAIVTQCLMLNANQIPTPLWPLLSSDLSPIEHTWNILGRRMRDLLPPASLEDLRDHVQHRLIAYSGISSTKINSKHCATQCHED